MQFVDLVVQGVRRFTNPQKLSFKPGLNVIYGPNESGKSTLNDCVRALLYPLSAGDCSDLIAWESPDLCRAALTFNGDDGATYRIVRDFVKDAVSLSKLNPDSGKFEAVASSAADVESAVREAGAAPADLHDALFGMSAERLSLEGGGTQGGGSTSTGGVGDAGITNVLFEGGDLGMESESESPEQKAVRLEELRESLVGAEKLDKLQFEVDGLEGKKFELENKLKGLQEIENKISQAKGRLLQVGNLEGIDDEMEKRLVRFQEQSESFGRDQARKREEKDRKELEAQTASSSFEPFYMNRLFMGGVAGVVLSIVGWIFVKPLILLIVPSLGLAGFGFYRWTEDAAKMKKLGEGVKALEKEINDAERRFEVETAVVKELIRKLDVHDVGDILERKQTANKVRAQMEQLKKELAEREQSPDVAEARERMGEITSRIEEIQDEIARLGGMPMDPTTIRREIEKLEAELSGKAPASAASGPAISAAPSNGSKPGAISALLAAAATAAGENVDEFIAARHDQLLSRLSAFTGGRHAGGEISGGAVRVAAANGQGNLEWEKLSSSTRLAAYLSLGLGSAEALERAAAFFWDDVAGSLDERRLAAVAGSLKELVRARGSQAVWITSRKELAASADHLIKLAG